LPGCLLGWYTIVSCRRCRCAGRNCARSRWCGGRCRAAHRDRWRRCCRGFGCTSGQNQVDQREHNQCSFHRSFSFRQSEPPNGLRFSRARSEEAKRLAGCARCGAALSTAPPCPLRYLACARARFRTNCVLSLHMCVISHFLNVPHSSQCIKLAEKESPGDFVRHFPAISI
jgi:hypothetical protein